MSCILSFSGAVDKSHTYVSLYFALPRRVEVTAQQNIKSDKDSISRDNILCFLKMICSLFITTLTLHLLHIRIKEKIQVERI